MIPNFKACDFTHWIVSDIASKSAFDNKYSIIAEKSRAWLVTVVRGAGGDDCGGTRPARSVANSTARLQIGQAALRTISTLIGGEPLEKQP
ncbi:hypothetical protein M0802_015830 [Mischocyttarus mexicanus]|nr:hypothetical protein M0802_015830 [Mischocyttarus mexicanus]